MDPQAAWSQLQNALRDEDWDAVHELAESLLEWLDRGGFPPVTGQGNAQDPVQQRTIAIRSCRSALQRCEANWPS